MRITGGHAHALGEEAAAVVRQAVSLAGRRGHAQVTPLHIARAMLSASPAAAGVLRAACLRSQSHLLQHNALDLRLDVALDRLPSAKVARPASVAAMINHRGDHAEPAPSNAFVAALKRVQAHRGRRGAIVGGGDMVELEQLVVSVLDDPSVDRAMRAAGFSVSQVRASVEGAAVPSEQSSWASCDVTPSPKKARAGEQPALSLQIVPELHPPVIVVPDGSECQASKTKSGTGRPASFLWPDRGCRNDGDPSLVAPPPQLYNIHRINILRHQSSSRVMIRLPVTLPMKQAASRRPKFTELTAKNLKILCHALEVRVPWHADIVTGISSTVLRCRSGVTRRRAGNKPTTWLLFRGRDAGGKTAVARELARLVFGSYSRFTTLQAKPDVPAILRLKRRRSPDNDGDVGARLFEAIVENPHRVILIEGVDRLDRDSEMRIKDAIAEGTMVGGCNGDVVGLEDAIVVLSSDVCHSRSVVSCCSQRTKVKRRQNIEEGDAADIMEETSRRGLSWDLNVCAVDGEVEEDGLADDEGILDVVDGVFLFN